MRVSEEHVPLQFNVSVEEDIDLTVNVLDKGYVRLVDYMGSDLSVVNAARASFAKESKLMEAKDAKLIAFLAREGHFSPFRHAFLTFEFKAPLMVARQHWKYVVGSDHCQPAGTLVSVVSENKVIEKPIENLTIGEKVVSFGIDDNHIYRRGKNVDNIWTRNINEEIITLETDKYQTKYTKEHPCVFKIGKAFENKYVVYLMRKGNQFRIGQTVGHKQDGSIGFRRRFQIEGGDAIWILDVCDTRREAKMQELLLSAQYGIPTIVFRATNGTIKQEYLDEFWTRVDDLTKKANRLLDDKNLLIDSPLYDKTSSYKNMKSQTTIVASAANLISGMKVMVPTHDARGYEKDLWHSIKIFKEWYTGTVYSISVEDTHTYVADGIVTHNCMDGWNEGSRRYITSDEEFYVIGSDEWRSQPDDKKQGSGDPVDPFTGGFYTDAFLRWADEGYTLYKSAMEAGICTEQARVFLPAYALYTNYRWSASLQSVIHFLRERLAHDAQVEIQQFAKAVYRLVQPLFPTSMQAFGL